MKLTRRIAAAYRALTRGYDAASGSARTSSWQVLAAPVAQTHAARPIVSQRTSFAIGSIPLAAAITDVQVNAEIHDGPSVRSGHRDPTMGRALEDGFAQWGRRVTTDGRDLTTFAAGMVRSRIGSGEGLARMLTGDRGELQIQQLPAEQLDASINHELLDGGRIVQGIESNAGDEIVAGWVRPDASDLAFSMIGPAARVPANDLLHIFEMKFPGQRRGISMFAPVLTRLNELERLQDALLARANTAALFGAFVSDVGGTAFGDATPTPPTAADLSLEPGVMRILPSGTSVSFPSMPDNADAPSLLRHMQRDILSGVGIPYELGTGDMSATNYSSAKLGLEAYKRRIKAIRASLLVPRMLEPIWRRWVLLEILSGRLYAPDFARDPEPYFAVTFLFPEWAALDPYKDTQADVLALGAGLRSRAEIIAARGRDIADVDAEIAADTFHPAPPPAGLISNQEPQNAAA